MSRTLAFVPAGAAVVFAATMGMLSACGGSEEAAAPPESHAMADALPRIEGARVSGRDEALRIVARGVVAPMYYSELAQAVLVRVFELRSRAPGAAPPAASGDRWKVALDAQPLGAEVLVEGQTGVEIEAADNAEGLILRGEAGFVRAVVRFERTTFGAAQVDGALTLEVSRTVAGAGSAHRSQAETLSITDGLGTRHWSYLDAEVDAQQFVQRLTVVSDLTVDPAAPVWIDVTSSEPGRFDAPQTGALLTSGRYVATGVTGFLNARLTLQVSADGSWTVAVDNDKDDQIDFVVHASPDEVRALPGAPNSATRQER
jgi:hypothetical protein